MPFDALITNAGRLRILTALAAENPQEFVRLRGLTRLTDGNLSSHAKRLQSAGLVTIEKAFRQGKPVTTFLLTDDGRRRLSEHVERLLEAVRVVPDLSAKTAAAADVADDEWVD